jgi:hypothetical protein
MNENKYETRMSPASRGDDTKVVGGNIPHERSDVRERDCSLPWWKWVGLALDGGSNQGQSWKELNTNVYS